jgi:hypothetical protein
MNPPNLRLQQAVHGPMCRSCANFDGRDRCKKYDAIVAPNVQCDSFDSIFLKRDRQYAEP